MLFANIEEVVGVYVSINELIGSDESSTRAFQIDAVINLILGAT